MIVDCHSHILPELDDGSRSLKESLAMLQQEARQDIRHVIATPHFYARRDNPETFLRERARAAQVLRQVLARFSNAPKLYVGAEVHFFHGMSESDILTELTIDKKGCILVEMPYGKWTADMYRELENIWVRQGLKPVIAHVDRYIHPLKTRQIPEQLAQLPVLVQANADFFLNRATAGFALRLLKADRIHLLGSDCHNLTDRAPNLGDAVDVVRRHLGEDAVHRLNRHAAAVLEDDSIL